MELRKSDQVITVIYVKEMSKLNIRDLNPIMNTSVFPVLSRRSREYAKTQSIQL